VLAKALGSSRLSRRRGGDDNIRRLRPPRVPYPYRPMTSPKGCTRIKIANVQRPYSSTDQRGHHKREPPSLKSKLHSCLVKSSIRKGQSGSEDAASRTRRLSESTLHVTNDFYMRLPFRLNLSQKWFCGHCFNRGKVDATHLD
jgi:hypothetical protein